MLNRWKNIIYMLLFFSGCCGLIYEIVWVRMLSLVFGNTTWAVSTVLASFMGGLSLGSLIFGRLIDRWGARSPLLVYGILEVGIGLYALELPYLLKAVKSIYIWCHQEFGLQFHLFALLRLGLSLGLLILPTTLMGATLPVISKLFISSQEKISAQVAKVYGINTLGAVLGVTATGFFLLPLVGVSSTHDLAAILNLFIGTSAMLIWKYRLTLNSTILTQPVKDITESPSSNRMMNLFILVGIGFSGLASLIYEVAWTRVLCLIIGSSVYAFSIMLLSFIFGIGLGSLFWSKLNKARMDVFTFGLIEILIGVFSLSMTPVFDRLPIWFLSLFQAMGREMVIVQLSLCFLVMLPATVLMGVSFPLASQIYARRLERVGNHIGCLYFVNNLGCILGSLLVGFLFIPWLGTQKSILLAAAVNLAIGSCAFILFGQQRVFNRGLVPVFISLLFLVFVKLTPEWNKKILSSGVAIYGHLTDHSFWQKIEESSIIYYQEGLNATVSVHEKDGNRYLRVNGKTDASTSAKDMITQLLLAYLPYLLHPHPDNGLVIGFGSGVTAGALAQGQLKQVECVEIEEAVIKAGHLFSTVNHNVLNNPKLTITINDARNHLLGTKQRYDLIISEPSNPWMAGIGSLFTREFYLLCLKGLKEGGLMCQWLQTYGLVPQDVKMVIKTFKSVFTEASVWKATPADLLLIGSTGGLEINYPRWNERVMENPNMVKDVQRLSAGTISYLLSESCLLNATQTTKFVTDTQLLNTDDQPFLEFSAPKGLYLLDTVRQNLSEMDKFKGCRAGQP